MVQNLFSYTLPPFEGEIENLALQESISLLTRFLGKRKLSILSWDENHIAIPLKLTIELPPLGNFEGIDIRSEEHVLLVFNLKGYPKLAPLVHSDRPSFPKNRLAHLYIAKENRPPAFCYVKGSMDEWYANKRIPDLVIRIRNWLRDAASGELTEDGNRFDPLRLEGYRGTAIYSYDEMVGIITTSESFFPNSNFAIGLFENTAKEDQYPSFKLEKIITSGDFAESLKKYIASLKELAENKTFKVRKYHLGYIVWSGAPDTHGEYCVELPRSWENFKKFCADFTIDIAPLEAFIAQNPYNFFPETPIITALKRPKQLIGFSSTIEFVNFYIELKDENKVEGKLTDVPVHFQAHNEPLTTAKAQLISGGTIDFKAAAIIGCGALGSKVALHFIRNGVKDLLLLDHDKLSPHNLVRHGLTPDYEGLNKALALAIFASRMYRSEDLAESILPLPFSGGSILDGTLAGLKKDLHWMFDFTASESFFQQLILPYKEINHIRICRGNISDGGNLGVLLFEGKERNPRMDDLQVLLYSTYKQSDLVNGWLKREAEKSNDNIRVTVGVGCNSETIILSDDMVSSHASYFSLVIKEEVRKPPSDNGKIFLHQFDSNTCSNSTTKVVVPPLVVLTAINDPSWEVRIKPGIIEGLKSEMGIAMPHETGGIFVGVANYKSKTIHVVDLIEAPPDSKSNPACFYRGISGLPEKVGEININSGQQLGYIGEWHSHPFGPNTLSSVDMNTVRRVKKEFSELTSPLPVFLMIITPTDILPYVF